MSTNASGSTAHFGLSQWGENDRILREDFNHDNAAIDAALKQQQDSIATQIQSALGQICVQKLYSQTLSSAVSSVTIDLSGVDMSQYGRLEIDIRSAACSVNDTPYLLLRINGDSTSGHYTLYSPPSFNNQTGIQVGRLYSDYLCTSLTRLWDMSGKVAARSDYIYTDASASAERHSAEWSFWKQGGLAAIRNLTLASGSGSLKSGFSVTVYGWKK